MTTKELGWAVITGASSGLGAEFARQLSVQGYDLVLVARRKARLDDVAREVGARSKTVVIEADLGVPGAAAKLVRELEAQSIEPSLLVNNAGVGHHGNAIDFPVENSNGMVQLNVIALTELSIAIGAKMAARKKGAILNVSSTASFQPTPSFAVYGGTKAFVTSFTAAFAEEMRPYGVRVLALCPGPTRTEFMETNHVEVNVGDWAFMTAEACVSIGLSGLEHGKTVVVPGFLNRLGAALSRAVPIRLATVVSGKMMGRKSAVPALPPRSST